MHTTITDTLIRDLFDAIWSGDTNGFSEAKVRVTLDENRRLLDDLNAKRITPRRIVGPHMRSPLTTARAYLTQTIAEAERDLAAEGRTNSVNIANVIHRLPAGHPAKGHRVHSTANGSGYAHLFRLVCACGQSECGYSATTAWTARTIEAHMADGKPLR